MKIAVKLTRFQLHIELERKHFTKQGCRKITPKFAGTLQETGKKFNYDITEFEIGLICYHKYQDSDGFDYIKYSYQFYIQPSNDKFYKDTGQGKRIIDVSEISKMSTEFTFL